MEDKTRSILAELANEKELTNDNLARALSFAKVENAKTTDAVLKLADGGGLLLFVTPPRRTSTGKPGRNECGKVWRYRYRLDGKEQTYTIGAYPAVGLADARTEHRAARWLVERGIHPLAYVDEEKARRAAVKLKSETNTFRAVWERFNQSSQSNLAASTVRHRQAHFDNYILPALGDLRIDEIKRRQIADLLSTIDTTAPVTAKTCRGYIKQVLNLAVDLDLIQGNPTPSVSVLVKQQQRTVTPRQALPVGQIGRFLVAISDAPDTDPLTKAAMRLLLLTWGRTGEIVGAEWSEFDLDGGVWRIPAERMKAREVHTVYLSRQAVKLLRDLALLSHGRYLFPNRRRPDEGHMNRMTLTQWRNRFGFEHADIHGFRAVASTWANESGKHLPDVVEVALAHKEADRTRAAYNRAEFVDGLRTLWQSWADFLDEREAVERGENIISLDTRKTA